MTFYIPKKALLMCATRLRPQDVFATSLYTGNGGTQTITNGLDLAGKGGLVWTKWRSGATFTSGLTHRLLDTSRGEGAGLHSDNTQAEDTTDGAIASLSAGYRITTGASQLNFAAEKYVSWSFRRAKKFFDIVTYTGNGQSGRQIPHGLGDVPGMIVVKARNPSGYDWTVWHRSVYTTYPTGSILYLNLQNAAVGNSIFPTPPTNSTITFSENAFVNANGIQYVAYLFAHNPDLIDCGSYVGNGSTTGPVVTCGKGWTPQFILLKGADQVSDWTIHDTKRSTSNPRSFTLKANSSAAEDTYDNRALLDITATGFQPKSGSDNINIGGKTYLYLAIRSPT